MPENTTNPYLRYRLWFVVRIQRHKREVRGTAVPTISRVQAFGLYAHPHLHARLECSVHHGCDSIWYGTKT